MEYTQQSDKVLLTGYDHFDITQTLECGQCFRAAKLGENEYRIIALDRILYVKQYDNTTELYPCSIDEFEGMWRNYFDLDRDYHHITKTLYGNDEVIRPAIESFSGIRILQQDPWECLISFIISQNKSIPMIKQVIQNISERYGRPMEQFYSFPKPEDLSQADIDQLMECKTGFRAKYIRDAVGKVRSGEVDIYNLHKLPMEEAREILISIKGVGGKIADCVLLFGMGKTEVFPTDVWIKRVMEFLYFQGDKTSIGNIHALAQEKFGEYAGFAQEYLYAYARGLDEFKDKKKIS